MKRECANIQVELKSPDRNATRKSLIEQFIVPAYKRDAVDNLEGLLRWKQLSTIETYVMTLSMIGSILLFFFAALSSNNSIYNYIAGACSVLVLLFWGHIKYSEYRETMCKLSVIRLNEAVNVEGVPEPNAEELPEENV